MDFEFMKGIVVSHIRITEAKISNYTRQVQRIYGESSKLNQEIDSKRRDWIIATGLRSMWALNCHKELESKKRLAATVAIIEAKLRNLKLARKALDRALSTYQKGEY
jgi:hypothetical protein